MLGEPDDLRLLADVEVGERRQLLVLALLERRIDGPPVRATFRVAEPDLDPVDHLVGKRVAELVGVHVCLARRMPMKSVSRRSMIRCLRTTRSARSIPVSVRIASLCSPRSTSPSASSLFSISPADARETPSISATREAIADELFGSGRYSPIGKARK